MNNLHTIGPKLSDVQLAKIWTAVTRYKSNIISFHPKYGVMFWKNNASVWDHWGDDQREFDISNWIKEGRPQVAYIIRNPELGERIA